MFVPSLFKNPKYLLAIMLAGFAMLGVTTAKAEGPSGVKNVLLVHGAWADGSSWDRVIPKLQADGYNVTAVQLPLSSLAADVAVVQRALAREDGKTLLVGHSYGGVVITEAGTDSKVAGLVYVAAFAPDAGESALSLTNAGPPTPIGSQLVPDDAGFLKLSDAGVADDFAQDLSPAEQRTIAATQGPLSGPDAFGAVVTNVAWKNVPSWFIIASNDRAIGAILEATMARRIHATTITVRSGHLVMLSHPTEVSNFIEKAASSVKP